MREIPSPLSGFRSPFGKWHTAFSPALLFANDEQGVWYDPSDLTTLFQDTAGTTPVTTAGQVVRRMDDKSGNENHATSTNPPTLRIDANGKNYLEFSSANFMSFANGVLGSSNHTVCYSGFAVDSAAAVLTLGNAGVAFATRRFMAEIAIRVTGGAEVYDHTNTNLAVITHVLDGTLATDNKAYRNGLELTPTTQSSGATLTTTSEGSIPAPGAGTELSFYGMVTLGRSVTAEEQSNLEGYMAQKAGIDSFYDVFLLAGQSNMAGRAPYDDGTLWPAGTNEWTQADELAAVTGNALDHPGMQAANMGPDISLSQAYVAANPSRKILFVPYAQGSTGFNDNNWNPGDPQYTAAVAQANEAIATPGATLRGTFWLQGEQDSLSIHPTTEASHAADLDAMISGMRSSITGASNMPFVLGQIPVISGSFFDKQTFVRAAIEDTPNRISNTAFAPNTDLTKLGDGLHYDAASLRIMGSRMFDQWDTLT